MAPHDHPVFTQVYKLLARAEDSGAVGKARTEVSRALHGRLLVIPLLAETGMTDLIDRVLVVDAPEAEQLRRVMARDHTDEVQARRILAAQARREQRLVLADDVVENSGDFAALDRQISTLHQRYLTLTGSG